MEDKPIHPLIRSKQKPPKLSLFQPGVSGNPNGKPKGTLNKTTEAYIKVRKLAADNYERMFNVLLQKGMAGESWAQQLYYKEFIPKKAKEDIVIINPVDKSVKGQIVALTNALSEFEEITHGEALDRLKTLAAVKLTDTIDDHNNEVKESRDSLMEKVDKLEYFIDLKRDVNKEEKDKEKDKEEDKEEE